MAPPPAVVTTQVKKKKNLILSGGLYLWQPLAPVIETLELFFHIDGHVKGLLASGIHRENLSRMFATTNPTGFQLL